MSKLKAPFPYAGGKSSIADRVWDALGDVAHYLEPFHGSAAVLLARPASHARRMESICDKDSLLCNAFRGLKFAPDEVAELCDWPVTHADLMARKKKLIANRDRLAALLADDDEAYDAKLAAYYIWCSSCWIGSGLTRPTQRPHLSNAGMGINAQRPHLSDAGNGINAKMPHIGHAGMGINAKRPHISHAGKGVNAQMPHLTNTGGGINAKMPIDDGEFGAPFKPELYAWFRRLQVRLRDVREVCGDWSRICGGNWQTKTGTCGILFDPPYSLEADRGMGIYDVDSGTVAHDVRAWCLERGKSADYKIVLAGYEGEHNELEKNGWRVETWKAQGGYGNQGDSESKGKANRHRERLWMSPNCLTTGLF